ncbi:hypothetical protein ACFLZ6_01155, partial [Nanoarchaeota archaeon]
MHCQNANFFVSDSTWIFASYLKLSPKTQTKAIKLIEKAQRYKLTSGRSPNSVAAASLYAAALMNKERRIQSDISNVANITEVTLRNRFQEQDCGIDLMMREDL